MRLSAKNYYYDIKLHKLALKTNQTSFTHNLNKRYKIKESIMKLKKSFPQQIKSEYCKTNFKVKAATENHLKINSIYFRIYF